MELQYSRSHMCQTWHLSGGVNGCFQTSILINELINHVRRKGKDIYITTLDLTNAFGSVSHKMIVDTMKQLGMPEFLIEFVRDTYRDNGTKIITSRGETRRIRIRRGVRQGCPLSPTLFNLCLEPLFKALDTVNKNEGITVETEDQEGRCSYTINAQAYADHLVLISNTRTEMMDLLNTVEMFCKFAGLKMAVQKCKTISYIKEGILLCSAALRAAHFMLCLRFAQSLLAAHASPLRPADLLRLCSARFFFDAGFCP